MADRPIAYLINEAQEWREPLVLELSDALEAEHKRAETWRALAKRDGEHAVAVAEAERQRADAAIFCSEAEVARLTKELETTSQANEWLRTAMYAAADEIDNRSEMLGHIALALRFAAGRPDRGEPIEENRRG